MGMATPIYGHQTHGGYYFYTPHPVYEPKVIAERDNAMAPAIYLNKQIDKAAPHKSINKRGKFKRSSKG